MPIPETRSEGQEETIRPKRKRQIHPIGEAGRTLADANVYADFHNITVAEAAQILLQIGLEHENSRKENRSMPYDKITLSKKNISTLSVRYEALVDVNVCAEFHNVTLAAATQILLQIALEHENSRKETSSTPHDKVRWIKDRPPLRITD